jgi:hypothetical protein
MALRPLNSVGGFSVGEAPVTIVAANGDITTANLSANGNVSFTGSNVSLGAVSNLHITGGSTGQFLQTNGSGALTWASVSSSSLTNGNSNIVIAANGNITMGVAGEANIFKLYPSGSGYNAGLAITGDLGGNILYANAANISGNISATGEISTPTGNVVAARLGGVLTTSSQPNITTVGVLDFLSVSGNATFGGNIISNNSSAVVSLAGNLSSKNANLGNAATANYFIGNGSLLTGTVANANYALYANLADHANTAYSVSGANVNGEVANANYATHAGTAYSVSGANVNGTVANANYALYSGTATTANSVDGANVTGTVANATFAANAGYANISGAANSVAGANVTGTVANANYSLYANLSSYANVAYEVSGANVTGTVANANYALYAGTADSANAVAGANVTGTVANANYSLYANLSSYANTAYAVDGANVNGTVANANYAAFANVTAFANSVAGANVTGEVANANYAAFSNLATTANTALAVAGANVSGTVANANYAAFSNLATTANTALAVAGANVSGEVANANYASFANSATYASNVNASGIVGTVANANYAAYAGDVVNAAQPNITSLGNLTTLHVTGTTTTGNANVSGTALITQANIGNADVTGQIIAGSLQTANINAVAALTVTGTTGINLVAGTGTIDAGNARITQLGTPQADSDAATKRYVDEIAQGLHTHDACKVATPDTLAVITGGTITYNNGSSGVGANLVTTGSFNLIDGVNVQTSGTRILVKGEANTAHNGIYVWSNATVIVRADDFDTSAEMAGGDFTFVQSGNTYDNTGWVMPDPVAIVGTSPVVWVQFSGAGSYQAGNGISIDGTIINANIDNVTTAIVGGNIVVKASAQLTTPNIGAATGTSVSLSGAANVDSLNSNANVTGGNLITVGSVFAPAVVANSGAYDTRLVLSTSSGIIEANTNGNATQFLPGGQIRLSGAKAIYGGTLDGSQLVLGTGQIDLVQNRGGNVTVQTGTGGTTANTWTFAQNGVFTAPGNIVTTANASFGNSSVTGLSTTANLSVTNSANLGAVGNVIITGGSSGQYLKTDGSGNLSWETLSSSGVSNGTSNVSIPVSNGNVNISANGVANVLIVTTGGEVVANALQTTLYAQIGGALVVGSNVQANSNINVGYSVVANGGIYANSGTVKGNTVVSKTTVAFGDGAALINAKTATTNSTSSNQTLVSIENSFDAITGIEFYVKGKDGNAKYSSQTVSCVASNADVDYSIYGSNYLGSSPGSLSVVAVANAIVLRVTPTSSNTTDWSIAWKYL